MEDFFNPMCFQKVFFNGHTISRQSIEHSIDYLAIYLDKEKESKLPFIYLFAPNHVKTLIAYFAIIRSGSIVVLVDPNIGRLELQEMMDITPPSALVYIDNNSLEFNYQREISFCKQTKQVDASGDLDGVCTIVYSSADDGYAKPIMLTRRNILTNAQAIKDLVLGYVTEESVGCALLPFHSLYGLQMGVLFGVLSGGSILIEDLTDIRQIGRLAENIAKYKVKAICSVPAVYHFLSVASEVSEQQLDSIMYTVSGGYKLSPSVFERFTKKFGKFIFEGYGLGEASPLCTHKALSDTINLKSVGQALSCCHITIQDEKDRQLPFGSVGEICVKGENVMKGYYKNYAATQKVLRNGWLHTGDLGKIDSDGNVYITGLKKRMLNVAGRKVYPAEVERLIRLYDNVEDVKVFRRASRICGDSSQAKIKLKNSASKERVAFNRWCLKNISHYKIPKYIKFY